MASLHICVPLRFHLIHRSFQTFASHTLDEDPESHRAKWTSVFQMEKDFFFKLKGKLEHRVERSPERAQATCVLGVPREVQYIRQGARPGAVIQV